MPSVGALLCRAGQALRQAGIDNPRMEARWLLAHALDSTAEALLRDPHAAVAPEAATRFHGAVARRARREPLALITGRTGFWTLELEVSADTLIPRADTETLVEAVLEAGITPRRVLDLGTGTGALLLAVLAEFPDATGVGVDIRPEAAALAARNAARHGLAPRAAFLAADWAAPLAGRFDLVLSNPPYIESADIPGLMPEVARHEPATALDGGHDGLEAYRLLTAALPALLTPRGLAVMELGLGQAEAVTGLAQAAGLALRGLRADLSGTPRAILLESGQKAIGAGGNSG